MIKKTKDGLALFMAATVLVLQLATPGAVFAAAPSSGCGSNGVAEQIGNGASDAAGSTVDCNGTGATTNDLAKIAAPVVNIFSIIVGAVAVIMIIYGGFRYITSGGESGAVGNAKNTLIYAIVGLIIVALAQFLVHFVLHQTTAAEPCQFQSGISAADPHCHP